MKAISSTAVTSFYAQTLIRAVCIQQPSFSCSALEPDEQKSPFVPRDPKSGLLLQNSLWKAESSALHSCQKASSEIQRFTLVALTYCTKAESQTAIAAFPSSKRSGAIVLERNFCFSPSLCHPFGVCVL